MDPNREFASIVHCFLGSISLSNLLARSTVRDLRQDQSLVCRHLHEECSLVPFGQPEDALNEEVKKTMAHYVHMYDLGSPFQPC